MEEAVVQHFDMLLEAAIDRAFVRLMSHEDLLERVVPKRVGPKPVTRGRQAKYWHTSRMVYVRL